MVSEKIKAEFDLVSDSFDKASVLCPVVGDLMLDRLQIMKFQPEIIVDLGANTGRFTKELIKLYPRAEKVLAVDISEKMLQQTKTNLKDSPVVCQLLSDAEVLALENNSVDMVFSNLTLHCLTDLESCLDEAYRVLKPGGLFIFSVFGPDTLREFCNVYAEHKGDVIAPFFDMHDLGDALLKKKFIGPVMEAEEFVLAYNSFPALYKELNACGSFYFLDDKEGLEDSKEFAKGYENYRDSDGELVATFEVILAHTWKPTSTSNAVALDENKEAKVSVEKIKIRT